MWIKDKDIHPSKSASYLVGEVDMSNPTSLSIDPAIVEWNNESQYWNTKNKIIYWHPIPTFPPLSQEEEKENLIEAFDSFVKARKNDDTLNRTWNNLNKNIDYSELYSVIIFLYQEYWQQFK